jgi:hypothetical protein
MENNAKKTSYSGVGGAVKIWIINKIWEEVIYNKANKKQP